MHDFQADVDAHPQGHIASDLPALAKHGDR